MLQDVKDLTASGVMRGLNTQYNLLTLQKDQSPNMMNVKINYDGTLEKRLGSNIQNAVIIANSAAAGFSPDSSSTLQTSIFAYWNMNEPSDIRYDSFNKANLNPVRSPGQASGIKNQALNLMNSSAQYLYAAHTNQLSGNNSFSIAGWFNLASTSLTEQRTLIEKIGNIPNNDVLLLHCDGADGSTSFPDSGMSNHTVTAVGNAQLDTAQFKFGTASGLFDGSGDHLTVPSSADFNFGTGDFTIDFQLRFNALSAAYLFSRKTGVSGNMCDLLWTGTALNFYINNSVRVNATWTPSINIWYHVACVRSGTNVFLFINGVQVGSTGTDSSNITESTVLSIGAYDTSASSLNGWLDEFRIAKGTAKWTSNFSSPTSAYSSDSQSDFEYKVFVDTDNKLTFSASSSGTATNGEVKANSIGALTTATWYNYVAYYVAASYLALDVNLSLNSAAYTSGIRAGTGNFYVGAESGNKCFDGRIDETGFWTKTLSSQEISDIYNNGSGNTYQNSFGPYPWASFDFGASALRWLTVSAGTGVYASSNLGVSWVNIATDRTATYQYIDRSKNVAIFTSDAYDNPLYWAGSIGTYASIIGTSTPLCKYSINFQGFLILLNSQTRKRSFNYLDENFQLSSTGWQNFDLPSSADDEITAVFILRRYLYVSTRYKIYRVSYVGGNPDWQFVEVKSWGFIPRTPRKVVISNQQQGQTASYSIGEVVVGLTWDRKLRIFDGSGDQILSNNIEKDNGMCDFALEKIPYIGSGPVISFAEIDPIPNVYRLCVAIGQESTQTSHFMNYDGRSQALYPYSNMNFNCMCIAESANRQYLMAFDRNGYCHMMDSGNKDGNVTPINDFYESPLMYEKTPSQSTKGHKTDLFFSNTTSGDIYYQDRTDFCNAFHDRKKFILNGSDNKLIHYETVDVPETYNTYQFRLSSSSGTNNPYRLMRYDHFVKGLGIGRNF